MTNYDTTCEPKQKINACFAFCASYVKDLSSPDNKQQSSVNNGIVKNVIFRNNYNRTDIDIK